MNSENTVRSFICTVSTQNELMIPCSTRILNSLRYNNIVLWIFTCTLLIREPKENIELLRFWNFICKISVLKTCAVFKDFVFRNYRVFQEKLKNFFIKKLLICWASKFGSKENSRVLLLA